MEYSLKELQAREPILNTMEELLAEIDRARDKKKKNDLRQELRTAAEKLISPTNCIPSVVRNVATFAFMYARATNTGDKTQGLDDTIRTVWINKGPRSYSLKLLESLNLDRPYPDTKNLPEGSWLLQLSFTLLSPYLSKDDRSFSLLENQVRKEWISNIPYVASGQWKGLLRAATAMWLVEKFSDLSAEQYARHRLRLALLFGDEKGDLEANSEGMFRYLNTAGGSEDQDKTLKAVDKYREMLKQSGLVDSDNTVSRNAGNLRFYPSFFGKTYIEIINPHSRETGAGDKPIYMETVAAGERGTLSMLYVPLYVPADCSVIDESLHSLELISHGIETLALIGIGAKTSSGFGKIKFQHCRLEADYSVMERINRAKDRLPIQSHDRPATKITEKSRIHKQMKSSKDMEAWKQKLSQIKEKLMESSENQSLTRERTWDTWEQMRVDIESANDLPKGGERKK